ncbi:MAG: bacillithiol biosynthesis deacetylase BshB1 [Saprospiraceae bacterium]
MKVDILAIGIHPDDVELSASGTLLKHAAAGKTFGLLDLSRGELGTRGTAETRRTESATAAKILGAAFRETLDVPDGLFVVEPEQWMKIVRVLRWCQPEVVICNAPDDRHPDHGRAARLALEACFYSGLEKIQTEWKDGSKQSKWRPKSVFHYVQDKQLTPDFIVDISPYHARKMEAILAYKTQFYNPDEDQEASTPISGRDFYEFLFAQDRVFGRPIQAEFAEGFICSRTPGVESLFDLK